MSAANQVTREPERSRKTAAHPRVPSFFSKKEMPKKLLILDQDLIQEFIQERRDRGIDQFDEVWEGVYIVPPLATNPHQGMVAALTSIGFIVITLEGRGQAYPGANVSD